MRRKQWSLQENRSRKSPIRWLQTAQRCSDLKKHCPKTQLVMLADRESDISQVIDYCSGQDSIDWIIRSEGSRVLLNKSKSASSTSVHAALAATKRRFTRTIDVRQRHSWGSATIKHRPGKADRRARTVRVTVHAATIILNDPRPGKHGGIRVNAVLIRETNPNKHDQPLEWLLLTSLPIDSREAIELIIEYYLQRWMIEIFFKVLKSGCKIESRRFEHIDRFLPALSLYLIVAWRSLYICRISRAAPNRPCTVLYTSAEWQSCWMIVNKKPPPTTPPKLMEMTKIIAQLGGYVSRNGAGPPGPQTVWIGIQRMHDFATAWLTFGPGATI
ncbi:MAG: IS4 family transposase [Pirellulaceae bacterium]